jgi:hypothetical protein
VAAYRLRDTSDVLSEILRPILLDAHAAEMKRFGEKPPAPKRPKKGGDA